MMANNLVREGRVAILTKPITVAVEKRFDGGLVRVRCASEPYKDRVGYIRSSYLPVAGLGSGSR